MLRKRPSIDERIVQRFLEREEDRAQAIVDVAPVFGKRYDAAVERLEEIEDVREALGELLQRSAAR